MIVGVPARGLIGWGGGLDLINSYVRALQKAPNFETYVFVEKRPFWFTFIRKCYFRLIKHKKAGSLIVTEEEAKKVFEEMVGKDHVVMYTNGTLNSNKLDKLMRKYGVDVCFLGIGDRLLDVSVPKVPYLYDFQYKYLTDLFQKEDCVKSDKYFENVLAKAEAVIVEAEDVRNDVEKFYPNHKAKVFVMPYTAIPEKSWLGNIDEEALQKYGLPEKNFLISNQIWMHKDHSTAFLALKHVLDKGYKDIYIVCTGKMEDGRDNTYISDLMKLCKDNGVQDNILFLGFIPKEDQIQIMKKSIAVIQPTRFEGNPGGGVGYNAVAIKKSLILSDIPVNQELHDECVTLFKVGDAEDLSNKMINALEKESETFSDEELNKFGEAREKALVDAIVNVLEYAANTATNKWKRE